MEKPCCVWTVEQRKYDIDPDSSWLKRLGFRLYSWLVETAYERWKFVPWDHRDAQGNYSWLERQGVFTERWRALQEAAKYPHGYALKLPVDDPLEGKSMLVTSIPSKEAKTKAYQRINERMVEFPIEQIEKLQRKLKDTDYIVRSNPIV